ncbi:redoxin family protein [Hirschia baltica]|uniref:Redoxin domain protein n=1 Tax=Hirschia baltica (strain ATCC 49814 / DSM 5838 / IFAM 1418) TaxID=582402 RepID=C6XQB3_HIRBI|nr:redoxin family protein [Hirschia baltica]ACT60412.1 Redoxin domain protein [Hirschia baltica ATCC 49814]
MSLTLFAILTLWVVVLAIVVMMWVMLRQIGVLYERVSPVGALMDSSGPEVGAPSPLFSIQNLNGPDNVMIGAEGDKAKLVFFLSPTCPVCKQLLPVLAGIRSEEGDRVDVVFASDGDANKHREFIAKNRLKDYPYVLSADLGMGYRVQRLPFAVVIDAEGIVRAKGLVNNREQLESLFNALERGVPSVQELVAIREMEAVG